LQEIIDAHRIVVFSKAACPYCSRAKAFLNWLAEYHIVELDERPELHAALIEMTSQKTVPAIFVNGALIGGFKELFHAHREGILQSALQ